MKENFKIKDCVYTLIRKSTRGFVYEVNDGSGVRYHVFNRPVIRYEVLGHSLEEDIKKEPNMPNLFIYNHKSIAIKHFRRL